MFGNSIEETHPYLRSMWHGPYPKSAARSFLSYYQTQSARARWNSLFPSYLKAVFGKSISQVVSMASWISILRYHSTQAMIFRAKKMLEPLDEHYNSRSGRPKPNLFSNIMLIDPATGAQWSVPELVAALNNLDERINSIDIDESKDVEEVHEATKEDVEMKERATSEERPPVVTSLYIFCFSPSVHYIFFVSRHLSSR